MKLLDGNSIQPAVYFILVTAILDSMSIGIIIPVFPGLIMNMEHCNESEAAIIGGWLMFSFAAMQFLASPVMGALSDRFGRRPVLLLSLLGFGIDFLLLAFAPNLGWLFLGRVLAGLMGASYTTASAYISDITTPENRSKYFGMLGAAFGVGFIIGPGLGGLLSGWGLRAPFFACAIISLLNLLYGLFVLPESLPKERRRSFEWKRANPLGAILQISKYRVVLPLLLSFFLLYLAAQAVMTNWQYYSMLKFGWNEKEVGFSIMMVGVLVAIVQGGLVRVVNSKIGNKGAVLIGLGLYSLGLFSFAFAPSGLFMLLASIPYCIGGINGPAMQAIMSASAPSNAQGELQGVITSTISVTAIIGPPMMAGIFAYYTSGDAIYFPGAAFFLAGIFVCFAWMIAYKTLHHEKAQ